MSLYHYAPETLVEARVGIAWASLPLARRPPYCCSAIALSAAQLYHILTGSLCFETIAQFRYHFVDQKHQRYTIHRRALPSV
jgi:hypothetical protein